MGAYSQAYKSGTISSINSLEYTISGFTPQASEVGRLIILTSGSGKLQHRKITAVSGQILTLAHSFSTSNLIGYTDTEPSQNDTFSISYDLNDLIQTDSDITQYLNNLVLIDKLTLSGGAYVFAKNKNLELQSRDMEIGNGGGFIAGYYEFVADQDCYVVDSCNMVDKQDGGQGNPMGRGNNFGYDFGLFDFYGGTIYMPNKPLWGCYDLDSPADEQKVRIFDVQCMGGFGGGISGSQSCIVAQNTGNLNPQGFANFVGQIPRIELQSMGNDQCLYLEKAIAPDGRAILSRVSKISDYVLKADSDGSGLYEVVAKRSEIDAQPYFIYSDIASPNHTIRYGNFISPSFTDSSLSLITDSFSCSLKDVNSTIVDNRTITNGKYDKLFARHSDFTNISSYKRISDGTLYAPYNLTVIAFDYDLIKRQISVEEEFSTDIICSIDSLLEGNSKSYFDNLSLIETSLNFYGCLKSYLKDNISGEEELLVDLSGKLANAGTYDVNIDPLATQKLTVTATLITIKCNNYIDDMITTGTISLLNGAIFSGTRTDVNGTVFPPQPISITNIIAGSRLQIFNTTTGLETVNEVVPGTSYISEYQEGGDYSDGDTVRFRITKLGKEKWFGNALDTTSGFSVLVDQVDSVVYAAMGVDGSTVNKFSPDYVNDQVDVQVGTNFSMAEMFAWWMYNLTTEEGIREFFGGITAIDEANFRINNASVNLFFDNTTSTNIHQTDNRRIFRTDGVYPVVSSTAGGGGIDIVWRNTILISQISDISDIKAKTDQLTFNGADVKATLDGEEVVTDTASRDASKADVSSIETKTETDARQVVLISEHNQTQTDISNLNNFDPDTDVVSNVTVVDTTNSNLDMRGTDNSNTVVPTNETLTVAQNTKLMSLDTDNLDVAVSTRATKADVDQALVDYNVDTKTNVKPSIPV